jgi:hypothetical protein
VYSGVDTLVRLCGFFFADCPRKAACRIGPVRLDCAAGGGGIPILNGPGDDVVLTRRRSDSLREETAVDPLKDKSRGHLNRRNTHVTVTGND